MAVEERVYTIPLRSKWVEKPRVARANVSVGAIQFFLKKHMKTDDVKMSPLLNERIWARGAKKPPAFAKVKVVVDEKGIVTAMLPEETLEITEKRGLKHKLLRKKGDSESKIVRKPEYVEGPDANENIEKGSAPVAHAQPKKQSTKASKEIR